MLSLASKIQSHPLICQIYHALIHNHSVIQGHNYHKVYIYNVPVHWMNSTEIKVVVFNMNQIPACIIIVYEKNLGNIQNLLSTLSLVLLFVKYFCHTNILGL